MKPDLLPDELQQFARSILSCHSDGGPLNVIGLKSQFGNGRKLTIEVREYFDSIHFTRRQGDERIVTNTDRPQESFGA